MRSHAIILLGLLAVNAGGCIHFRDVNGGVRMKDLTGSLGPKMGTIIEVSGTVVENESSDKTGVSESFYFRIDTVNGQKLNSPQLFASSAGEITLPDSVVEDR